jgi:hypothetical protein
MPAQIAQIEIPGYGFVDIKVETRASMLEEAALSRGQVEERLRSAFEDSIDIIDKVSAAVYERLEEIGKKVKPTEISIEFGVSIDTEVGAVFAKSSAGASFQVSLTWSKQE